ncbi:MAG: acetate/propionate family kinase [Bryobacterales bacterium]|nr:acetate/propionate family kinase [Bryobacterales bacterium]
MKVLVFNPGSNSLKFQFIDAFPDAWGRKNALGTLEPIGKDARLTASLPGSAPFIDENLPIDNLGAGAANLLSKIDGGLFQDAGIRRIADLDLIVCRVVHGGTRFREPVQADQSVVEGIAALDDLAPLHNAQSVAIIRSCFETAARSLPIIAVFDSAFHSTLPEVAYRYAIDYELAGRHGIRRYGFHGISHKYLMLRYAELQGISRDDVDIVTLHLEGGSSAAAIKNGQSVDTSMGLTPLEGLMMATRCGDLDPAIVGFLSRKEQVDVATVEELLNKKSGLLGVSGYSPDTRILVQRSDQRSQLALDMFAYRVRKYIGAYIAAMGGARAVVFAGGIGENTPDVRRRICTNLGSFGLDLDDARNMEILDREGCITRSSSRLHAWVIPTEEGLMMAREAVAWRSRHI